MRTATVRFLTAAALAALICSPAFAQQRGQGRQGPGGFGGGFGGPQGGPTLLLNKSVQDELKLTDDQKAGLKKVQETMMTAMGKAREEAGMDREKMMEAMKTVNEETTKEIAKIELTAPQAKRFKEIQLQQKGLQAYNDPEVQKTLALTDKQKDEIKDIVENLAKDSKEIREAAGNDRTKMRETFTKIQALNKEAKEKVVALLTTDQKTAWVALAGDRQVTTTEAG